MKFIESFSTGICGESRRGSIFKSQLLPYEEAENTVFPTLRKNLKVTAVTLVDGADSEEISVAIWLGLQKYDVKIFFAHKPCCCLELEMKAWLKIGKTFWCLCIKEVVCCLKKQRSEWDVYWWPRWRELTKNVLDAFQHRRYHFSQKVCIFIAWLTLFTYPAKKLPTMEKIFY